MKSSELLKKGDLNVPDKEASLITQYPKDNKNYKS
jgi:hypothetical protein